MKNNNFNKAIQHFRNTVFYANITSILNKIRYPYSTPAKDQTIYIDPTNVNHILTPHFCADLSVEGTYVRGGQWDTVHENESMMLVANLSESINSRGILPIENYGLYTSMLAHFEHKVPWEDTDFYNWIIKQNISAKSPTLYQRFQSQNDIKNRLNYIDELYNNIKINGYKETSDPILIDITRDGTLVLDDGRHRLIIAKILDIAEIPAQILVRHSIWQKIREGVANGELQEPIIENVVVESHPDIYVQ